ncbi:hypothetical protein NFHSH190041_19840 [Shewanella sp. NFH-SH190041]|uniref:hypothetical protein n=1 Tax=Shewanella sp. NFH-SH190041 TaxID=2950245 RepID=UPI0021C4B604|nr:hypothetical protein [Shewanella sp. NFH-SH190041]BDM64532.1 hypothetical protein NFHSH190041_19840 [Shewanella sp. NFH-SH190041]
MDKIMTQNIEQRTVNAVKQYETASGTIDKFAHADDVVNTPVGARKTFPKISKEWEENAAALTKDWKEERDALSIKSKPVLPWTAGETQTDLNQQRRFTDGHTYLPKTAPALMGAEPDDNWIAYTADKSDVLSDVFGSKPVDLTAGLVITPSNNQYPKLSAFNAIYELADNSVNYIVKSFIQSVDNSVVITLSDNSVVTAYPVAALAKTPYLRSIGQLDGWGGLARDIDVTDNLINACAESTYVKFPKNGMFYLRGMKLKSGLTIDLNGSTLIRPRTETTPGMFEITDFVSDFNLINGFTNDGYREKGLKKEPRHTIYIHAGGKLSDSTIKNVTFIDSHTGIHGQNASGSNEICAENVLITGCKALGSDSKSSYPAITSFALAYFTTCDKVVVDKCYGRNIESLVLFDQSYADAKIVGKNNVIQNCIADHLYDTALYSYGRGTKILNNTVIKAGKDAIKVLTTKGSDSGLNIITGNIVIGTGGYHKKDGTTCITIGGRGNIIKNNVCDVSDISDNAADGWAIIAIDSDNSINENKIIIADNLNKKYNGILIKNTSVTTEKVISNFGVNDNSIIGKNAIGIGIVMTDGYRASGFTISGNTIKTGRLGIYIPESNAVATPPLMSLISSNKFHGLHADATLVGVWGYSCCVLSNNSFTGLRRRDLNSSSVLLGDGNMSDMAMSPSPDGDIPHFICQKMGTYVDDMPSSGTFFKGQIVSNGTSGRLCTQSGTFGTLNNTVCNGLANTNILTLNDVSNIYASHVLVIDSVIYSVIDVNVDTNVITVNKNLSIDLVNIVVHYSAPIFSEQSPFYA